jgi:hypothetical protein
MVLAGTVGPGFVPITDSLCPKEYDLVVHLLGIWDWWTVHAEAYVHSRQTYSYEVIHCPSVRPPLIVSGYGALSLSSYNLQVLAPSNKKRIFHSF